MYQMKSQQKQTFQTPQSKCPKLEKITVEITRLLRSCNYKQLISSDALISRKLAYFLKYTLGYKGAVKGSGGDGEGVRQRTRRRCLEGVMRMVGVLVKSGEDEKYGHVLPKLGYLVRNYQKITGIQCFTNQQQLSYRVKLNQQSEFYKLVSAYEITEHQAKLLHSNLLQNYFTQVLNNQILLPCPQCLCCSQIFLKNFTVQNSNKIIPVIAPIATKNQIYKMSLMAYFTALLNQGGGVLIIGAVRTEKDIRVVGMRFKDHLEIAECQDEIRGAFIGIQGRFCFTVDRVLVHGSLVDDGNLASLAEEYMRICFRVFVLPHQSNKAFYVQTISKTKTESYQFYQLNPDLKPTNLHLTPQIYHKIHQKHAKKSQPLNSHQNIYCHVPHQLYSKTFTTYAEMGLFQQNLINFDKSVQGEEYLGEGNLQNFGVVGDTLEFKYSNSSLFVLSTKQNDRWVGEFCRELEQRKYGFKLQKPFQSEFKEGIRSIWMISHKINCNQLKKILQKCQSQQLIPPQTLKLMPVHKILQIPSDKFTEYTEKIFQKRFRQKFNQMYRKETGIVGGKNQEKMQVHLYFNDFTQAIYAYLIFQSLQLFPYFIKEGFTSLKK